MSLPIMSWRARQDATDPARLLEQFMVASWERHQRQHEHITRRDRRPIDAPGALWITPPTGG